MSDESKPKGRAAMISGGRKGSKRSPWRGSSISRTAMKRSIKNGFVPPEKDK